jgi:hypothetical protein
MTASVVQRAHPTVSTGIGGLRSLTHPAGADSRNSREAYEIGPYVKLVMPGLDPGFHRLRNESCFGMDGRVKPGHDEGETR